MNLYSLSTNFCRNLEELPTLKLYNILGNMERLYNILKSKEGFKDPVRGLKGDTLPA